MEQEYIKDDIVMYDNKIHTIMDTLGVNNYELSYIEHPVNQLELSGVSITPEILEKNGWDKDNSKFYEYDDDPEYENRYFNWTYDLTLDLDDCSVYKGTSGILYGLLSEVIYVHQLQHLLFGLGLNSEIEM